ncbi:MAG: NAD(P)/FAD-dependent oxidoreductase [bacterium]
MAKGQNSIVVVGAGFGGLRAVRVLARADARVILLDQNNYHLFQPLLYQVATSALEPEQVAKPIRSIVGRQKNLQFLMARVRSLDLASRKLTTTAGSISYDYLILALGAQTWFPEIPGLKSHALPLKTLMDAIRIRNHVLRCFEKASTTEDLVARKALLTLAVAGAGPTGVEMAGALSELVRVVQRRDYPSMNPEDFRVMLVEASDCVLGGFPPALRQAAVRILKKKGVEIRLSTSVEQFDGEFLKLSGSESMACNTLIWAAGVRGRSLLQELGVKTSPQGRLLVEATLQVPGYPEVYAIGDGVHLESGGKCLPMMAPVAIQMGEMAAMNIMRQLGGQEPLPFRYRDPGLLATIGKNAAVAKIHGLELKGFPAWVVWLLVHLLSIVGFRNRIMVLINWAWDYLFYDRQDRIIVTSQDG